MRCSRSTWSLSDSESRPSADPRRTSQDGRREHHAAVSHAAVNKAASSEAVRNGSLARAPVRSKTRCTWAGPPISPNSQPCAREAASASSTRCSPLESRNVTPYRSNTTRLAPDAVTCSICSRTCPAVSISTAPNGQTRTTSCSVRTTTPKAEGSAAWLFTGTRPPRLGSKRRAARTPSERPDRSALVARPARRGRRRSDPCAPYSRTPGSASSSRRSGFLEPRHVRPLLCEQERLDRHVVVDVGLRQEHPHLAAGRLLDDAREVVGHLLLEAAADVLDRGALATLG